MGFPGLSFNRIFALCDPRSDIGLDMCASYRDGHCLFTGARKCFCAYYIKYYPIIGRWYSLDKQWNLAIPPLMKYRPNVSFHAGYPLRRIFIWRSLYSNWGHPLYRPKTLPTRKKRKVNPPDGDLRGINDFVGIILSFLRISILGRWNAHPNGISYPDGPI